MQRRQNTLHKWLEDTVGDSTFTLLPLAGDASFRQYYRLNHNDVTRIVMDAPPEKEAILPFVNISNILTSIGIHTPTIYAVDEVNGFILLEDLGDALFLDLITRENASVFYTAAINTLLKLQQCPVTPFLPRFNKTFMLKEIALFREWFLEAYLDLRLTAEDQTCLNTTFNWLVTQIEQQPIVFIHRDYHSRNLMICREDILDIGVIDFQDAMAGPFTYDIVSLLKDCYIQWPREQVLTWLKQFYDHLPPFHQSTFTHFIQAFDLCGLQRHLKVLGIFCRLHLRDNKSGYLRDLPLTLNYVTACLESYPELEPFYRFIEQKVRLPFVEKIT